MAAYNFKIKQENILNNLSVEGFANGLSPKIYVDI